MAMQTHNLSDLENLTEETLLGAVKARFEADDIYTYVGEILVTVNPFRWLPTLYDDTALAAYRGLTDRTAAKPHIFAVASSAYEAMLTTRTAQVCVISGESGAGKTEAAKLFVKQIVGSDTGSQTQLERRLVSTNPLLEAFGNAKTGMNHNSSRFGKYTQLHFDEAGALAGASMRSYLLEKCRVVAQPHGEQNFHVFNLLMHGLGRDRRAAFGLAGDEHAYVDPIRHTQGPDDRPLPELFAELEAALGAVGLSADDAADLFHTIGGIINLGDVEFEADDAGNARLIAGGALAAACRQLAVDEAALELALCRSVIVVRGEETEVLYKLHEAEAVRDALAKALYERQFGHIIAQCNTLLAGPPSGAAAAPSPSSAAIGILDIFGFESFGSNGFEQLLINLANEQLQFFFNEHIFAMELAEYAKEGVAGTEVSYQTNEPLLEMILAPRAPAGLLAILDEESIFPKATAATTVEKFHAAFSAKPAYARPRGNECRFTLTHYAGTVEYDGDEFLEKNRDTLAVDVVGAMALSDNDHVRFLFNSDGGAPTAAAATGRGRKGRARADAATAKKRLRQSIKHARARRQDRGTVGGRFKASLTALMSELSSAAPHFVRCIKPNREQAARAFNDDLVLRQLRYTGMLEATRIRREGYSTRLLFAEFVRRYRVLGPLTVQDTAEGCRSILRAAGVTDYAIGRTKVFLRYYHADALSTQMRVYHDAQITVARHVRGLLARRLAARLRAERAAAAERAARGSPPSAPAPPKCRNRKRQATVKWFQENRAAATGQGGFEAWFYGIISRKEAEDRLHGSEAGTFLIRVAESRFGFSLSMVGASGALKHFAINQDEEERFTIDGTGRRHTSLIELAAVHEKVAISSENDLLLRPPPAQPATERRDLAELEASTPPAVPVSG